MPSSPNYKRNYKQEYATESKERRESRAARNRARYAVAKEVGESKIKGKDIGHKRALSKGGTNSKGNLVIQNPTANRSFARNHDGSMMSETSRKERKQKHK